jgi:DNA-binding cell septation regulator SpoVG
VEISRVSVLPVDKKNSRLRGYASIVFDNVFEVRNIRIIEDKNKIFFVVMPNRESTRLCTKCKHKTSFRDAFCSSCGTSLAVILPAIKYKNVAFPLSTEFEKLIRDTIIAEYKRVVNK